MNAEIPCWEDFSFFSTLQWPFEVLRMYSQWSPVPISVGLSCHEVRSYGAGSSHKPRNGLLDPQSIIRRHTFLINKLESTGNQ